MVLIDVNIMVYAHRPESPRHLEFRRWYERQVESDERFGISDLVMSGFIRIVTHPRIFSVPTSTEEALQVVAKLQAQHNCVWVRPGASHWEIFIHLCRAAGVKGNLVPNAFLAALAIESGCELITADRGYARFPGLRWRHPLD